MGINNFAILKNIGRQATLSKNNTSIIAFYWHVCWREVMKVMAAICKVGDCGWRFHNFFRHENVRTPVNKG